MKEHMLQAGVLLVCTLMLYPICAAALRRWLDNLRYGSRAFQRQLALWK